MPFTRLRTGDILRRSTASGVCLLLWLAFAMPTLADRPFIVIRTEAPGLDAVEIEEQVTSPVEVALAGMSGVRRVRSISRNGASAVALELAPQANIFEARQTAAERLAAERRMLPNGVTPMLLAPAGKEVLLVAVTTKDIEAAKTIGNEHLWLFAKTLSSRLRTVAGVAAVDAIIPRRPRLQVDAIGDRLAARGLDWQDVIESVAEFDFTIKSDDGLFAPANQLGEAIVGMHNGAPIRLRDVAEAGINWSQGVENAVATVGDGDNTQMRPANLFSITASSDADLMQLPVVLKRQIRDQEKYFGLDVRFETHGPSAEDLHVRLSVPVGTSTEIAGRLAEQVESSLLKIDGVAKVWRYGVAASDLADGVGGVEWLVTLRADARSRDAVADDVRRIAGDVPGARLYIGRRTNSSGFPWPVGTIDIRVHGPDLAVLNQQSQAVTKRLGEVAGLRQVEVVGPQSTEIMRIEIDRDAAARYGLKPEVIAKTLSTIRSQQAINRIKSGVWADTDVVITCRELEATRIEEIGKLPLATAAGVRITLGQVAKLTTSTTPGVIYREQGERTTFVIGDIGGRDRAEIDKQIRTVLESVELPLGYHIERAE